MLRWRSWRTISQKPTESSLITQKLGAATKTNKFHGKTAKVSATFQQVACSFKLVFFRCSERFLFTFIYVDIYD
jgi:hypothetical protein